MSWVSKTLDSSLGKKLIMSLTGLFLILFLVVHLAGNLQLLFPDEGKSFNLYANNMANNPLIRIVSILNFAFILLHVIYSILLTRRNKKARPIAYQVNNSSKNSTWASKNMGLLGTILLIFIVVHLRGFFYELKFGDPAPVIYDGMEMHDSYSIVKEAYTSILYVAFYVVSMGFLAFHLSHGFASAFQTLGLNHAKYSPTIKKVGIAFAILVPALYALIPLVMYIQSLN
jgi:succinate dehydrogenase / fumarate reductase, cytochrome b subunit